MAHRMHIAVLLALLVAGASAQSPPASCTAAFSILAPCYTYVTGPETSPSSSCCAGVANLNSNQPACLCSAITQLQASPTVNVTKALALPRDCRVAIDTSKCAAFALPPPSASSPPPPMMSPPMGATPPAMGATPPAMTATPPAVGPVMGPAPPMGATPPAMMGPSSPMVAPPMMIPTMAPSATLPPAPGTGAPGTVTNGPVSGPGAATPSQSGASAVAVSWTVVAAAAFTLIRLL